MSYQRQIEYEEDLPMEDALMVRDHRTTIAQTQRRQTRRQGETPVTALWPSQGTQASRWAPRDNRERSPYTTPTRQSSTIHRPFVMEGLVEDSEEDLPRTPIYQTVRREVRRQGGEVVAGLHQGVGELDARTRNIPEIEAIVQQHEAHLRQVQTANDALIANLTRKFEESDAKQAELAQALRQVEHRTGEAAKAQLGQIHTLFDQLTTTSTIQQDHQQQKIDSLMQQVQAITADGAHTEGQAAITTALNALKTAREEDRLEMEHRLREAMKQVELAENQWKTSAADPQPSAADKGKGKQARAESVRSSSSEEWRRVAPPAPEGSKPAEGSGGQGGNGGKGGGKPGPGDPGSPHSSGHGGGGKDPKGRDIRQVRQRRRPETPITHPAAPTYNDGPKQAKIPFNGDPKQDVRHWIDQMETLMELQPKVQWTDKVKILWSSLELTGSAASFWKNYKERLSVEPELGTWKRFKKELLIQYGNRTSQEQAKQKMDKLRQTGPIDDYLNEMQNLEWDAQVGPTVMKSMILTGINSSLETRLSAAIEEPEEFHEWLSWVRRVGRKDADVKARHEILRGRDTPKAPQKPASKPPRRSRDDRSVKRQENQSEKPKESLGATQAQKEKWQKERKCFRCGRENHRAEDCFATTIFTRATSQRPQTSRKRSRGNEKEREGPSGEKDQEEGSNKRAKLGPQGQAFRSRITNLED